MHKPLIASVLAIAVAFSSLSTAPARAASGGDIAKVIAGATALYLLGRTINKSGNSNRVSRAYSQPTYNNLQRYYDDNRSSRRPRQPVYDNDRNRQCLRQKYRDGRWITYRDKQCLKRYGDYRAEKPRECARKRWTSDGWVRYYERQCLRRYNSEAGYRGDGRENHEHRRRHEHD